MRGLQHAHSTHTATAHAPQSPRMVRDVFQLAKENAPAVIFIDEVDAIAARSTLGVEID
jgi:ATP-dependent 26S proteasome regulatory subunit